MGSLKDFGTVTNTEMGFDFDVASIENRSQIQAENSIVAVLELESHGLIFQVNSQI